MGVYLITILGGEPFFREDLLDFYAANPDAYFQVFTNGTLLDDADPRRASPRSATSPRCSASRARRELTDARRGPGIYRPDHGAPWTACASAAWSSATRPR